MDFHPFPRIPSGHFSLIAVSLSGLQRRPTSSSNHHAQDHQEMRCFYLKDKANSTENFNSDHGYPKTRDPTCPLMSFPSLGDHARSFLKSILIALMTSPPPIKMSLPTPSVPPSFMSVVYLNFKSSNLQIASNPIRRGSIYRSILNTCSPGL